MGPGKIYFLSSHRAIWLIVPGITAVLTLSCLVGVVMYAFYANCDPFKFGRIKRPEQVC